MISTVDLTVVHPYDPTGPTTSGFDGFLRGFVKELPADWGLEVIGVTRDRSERPLLRESMLELSGRRVSFVPVLFDERPERIRRVPLSLRFAVACRLARAIVPRGRIVQYQRFESILACPPGRGSRATCFLHNHPPELAGPSSDVRWRGFGFAQNWLLGRTLRAMDAVWAVDPRTPAWLAETFPRLVRASPASVWADPEVFYPGDEAERQADRAWLREEFDLAPTAEVCLFAGRLEAQKDVPTLIGAWAHVARRRPNAVLAIIGEGRSAPVARRLADRLGVAERIRWSGFRPWGELVRCYRAADCVACASAYEAGPRLVVEALACGTPSATFAVGEAPAMLEPLAELGLVVENRSERALGGAIARALELPGGPELAARCAAAAAPFTPARALAPVFERYREWFRQAEASP